MKPPRNPHLSCRVRALLLAVLLAQIAPAARAAIDAPSPGGAPAPGVAPPALTNSNAPAGDLGNAPSVITLKEPQIKGLITIEEDLNPFGLESASSQSLSLRETLRNALDQNLDIGISHTQEQAQRWKYISSLSKFLPDLNTGYSLYGITGRLNLPFGTSRNSSATAKVPPHFNIASAGFTYNGYQGGRILFGALQNRHLLRAQRAQSRFTISDVLLNTTTNYYNLLLSEALLEVRLRAVDTSEEQLRINSKLFQNGLATNLEVLQAKTQLSRDRQALIDQQIARRAAAIQLATILNVNPGSDIIPTDRSLFKVRLLARTLKIQELIRTAIEHRPELKQNEELRLAARNAITVAAAPLQPTVKLQGNIYGLGTGFNDMAPLYTIAMVANWNLRGMGLTDTAETQSARWQARQRLLISNKELEQVFNEVRNSYLKSMQSEQQITETAHEVDSAQEELRLAKIRFEHGLGSNIDVITAQRDLTTALINRAQAIIGFNIAQAQLLHDVGLISVDALTAGHPLQQI